MGLANPEDALGLELEAPAGVRIIGVIEDYALRPLLSEYASHIHGVRGIALLYGKTALNDLEKKKVSIKIKSGMTEAAPEALAKAFKAAFPEGVFEWYFLDNHINQYYTGEKIFFQQILLFAVVAIVIACLGLLGMIRNKVLETTKEIGIRKVLGARLSQVAGLLLKTTVRQVLIATLLGIPLSYYLIQEYLQRYSERITLIWWYYLIPILILSTLMLLTISSVLLNAAKANPVESLRHE
jgi:putative ABC transport system permease protein